ncbi:hypothetical protein [Pseudomonas fluorescens]|uniref:hypothetical protein n=1 Tax=Pseudomonas fluorescens TaxID=294 RepID=UPI0010DF252C|nr:hypothetical protein [Pseudomonas fluorescens]TCV62696.1 hypothetical protein EDB98_1124 [Pseudomonas fluorescens]
MKLILSLTLALFAGFIQAAEQQESWTLILTPVEQPATYVPGFISEKACETARWKWQDKQRSPYATAVCVQQ